MRTFFIIFSLAAFPLLLSAQTPDIERLQREQRALQEDIKNTNKLYLNVKKQTNTILDRINLITKQISSRKALINTRAAEIEALQQEEKRLDKEIERLSKELLQKQEGYARAIKGMLNNRYSRNKLLFVLSGKTWGESLRRMQYLKEYSKHQKMQAEEIRKQQADIAAKKESLTKIKIEKEKALVSLQAEQGTLQKEERQRRTEMSEAKGQQQQLQKKLREKQRQVDRLNARIERMIAEEVARQEREAEERRRAEEAARATKRAKRGGKMSDETSDESSATAAREAAAPVPRLEPSAVESSESFTLSRDFAANRGKLPMPVTGTASIVGTFGTKKHREWNIETNSNGIDISAQQGADIRSVFEGEVSKVFSSPGSNTCVIVRHGNYYTFYANIYDLFVKKGDKVKTGQSLGRIYTDPDTGLSTMHFQLWNKTTKLNPAPWLRR